MKGKIVFKITEFYQFKIVECKFLYIWHVKIKKMAHKNYLQIVLSLVIILCIMAVKVSNAQTGSEQSLAPVISGGLGVLGFSGNVGKAQQLGIYSSSRFGYNLGIEELVGGGYGIGLDFLGGQLAKSEQSPSANGNFQSSLINIGLNLNYHFDNNSILDESSPIAPYVSLGFSFLSFNSSSDMIAANGEKYYYWNDGSVRDQAQNASDALSAQILPMDHKYETDLHALALANEGLNYSQTSFAIPLGLGIAFKLTPECSIDLKATYFMTFTHYIDYISGSGISTSSNDAYLYTNVSFHYNFGLTEGSSGKEPIAEKKPKKQDDDTYYTSAKEAKNPPKATTPAPSKTTTSTNSTSSTPSSKSKETTTSGTPTKTILTKSPVVFGNATDNKSNTPSNNIPAELRIADTNNDGKISTQEINGAIDALFNGDSRYSVPLINKLIDYFFEQH